MVGILKTFGLAALTVAAFGATFSRADTTESVWEHHIDAWQARSLSEITSDYSDDSILVINNQIFKGRTAIGGVFEQLFKIFDNGVNRIDKPVLFDRFVYITWHFTPTGGSEVFGTDTFVIEDGVIVLQTIASPLYDQFPIHP